MAVPEVRLDSRPRLGGKSGDAAFGGRGAGWACRRVAPRITTAKAVVEVMPLGGAPVLRDCLAPRRQFVLCSDIGAP
jgi:hypothetical protein